MARITVEDCLEKVGNMYELVHLTVGRTRMLFKGADRLVECKNNNIVTALREIAGGAVQPQRLGSKEETRDLSSFVPH
jgi:DNA-directed RNA polymerase subunit omega